MYRQVAGVPQISQETMETRAAQALKGMYPSFGRIP